MVDIFKKRKFLGNENIIDCAQMLSVFGKPNTARVRDHWNSESEVSQRDRGIATF